MNFFEAQDRAKRRTTRLIALFVLAVLGTIAAAYAVALLLLGQIDARPGSPHPLWDQQLFTSVAGAIVVIVGVSSLYKWSQMRHGGSAVAEMVGGRRVDPRTTDLRERRLLNVVEEMAIASGVPVPAVYVLEAETAINAFAAGLTTSDAVVAVTRGTLDKLNRDELQGVVAHEFSHILNGDMRLNVKLTAIVFGILVIGLLGRGILRSVGRGRIRTGGGKNKGGGVAFILALGLALMIVGYVGYFFGRLIQSAVSRQREFLADASAVQFTRNPLGIGTALKKIGGYSLGSALAHQHAAEIGHFFFAQGFTSWFGGLWATHPPLEQRIRAVEPQWDGKFFEPPTLVDVGREPLAAAPGHRPPTTQPPVIPFPAAAVVAAIGTLGPAQVDAAQTRLASIPAALRDAARDPVGATQLVFALLLGADGAPAPAALAALETHAAPGTLPAVRPLLAPVAALPADARLAVVHLCLPALRNLDDAAFDRFVTALDELVHADGRVSLFEFALQKTLLRHLAQFKRPTQRIDFYSFNAVAHDIAVVLSATARAGSPTADDATTAAATEAFAARAFAAGAAQLTLLPQLALQPAATCGLDRLDTALDRLAASSLAIRQGVLRALAHAIGADGTVTLEEGELYRAIAAALDCPAPALAA